MLKKMLYFVGAGVASFMLVIGVASPSQASSLPLTMSAGVHASVASGVQVNTAKYYTMKTTNVYAGTKARCTELRNSLVSGYTRMGYYVAMSTDCKNLNPWPWQKDNWNSTIKYYSK